MIHRFLFIIIFIAGCSEVKVIEPYPKQQSRTIFTNGQIYTVDNSNPWANTMVFENGKILFIGDAKDALHYRNKSTKTIDLRGKFIMPGLVDSHTHPGLVAILSEDSEDGNAIELPTSSKAELLSFLKDYASEHWYQPFILLGSWDVLSFLPQGPTKEELDKIFPYRPVILLDNSGHSFWANSAALWLLDIDQDTPDLSNISYFVRDKQGKPTGWIKEFALFPYLGDLILPSEDIIEKKLLKFLNELAKHGVTTLWDAGNFNWDDQIYSILSDLDKEGKLPLHYEGSYHIWEPKQLPQAIEQFKALKRKYSGERLQFKTIKIHYDGVTEIQTAAMLDPFVSTDNNRGGILFSAQKLSKFMQELNKENIHLHLHTVGDRATQEALNAVELAKATTQDDFNIKITLSHLETVAPKDIKRFQQLGVFANFTPHWFSGEHFGQAGAHNIGEERAARSQEAHKFSAHNALITLSSDVTSESESDRANPFIGLQMSITRKEYNSTGDFKISPTQGLTLPEALAAYTINGAKQLGLGKEIGSLTVGKQANFIILENNLMSQSVEELYKTTPHAVYIEGVEYSGR